ncbi:MAG TPA: RNA-guided endonuclease TnpB family protein [Candidatus Nanoarchaeia archaeon]|nr:RNA-guided endonuclease TnpB family protein [Candidatus Nanoarchaeia archaeon]
MLRTYKSRLYPTKSQEERLLWTLEQCRFTYNKLLEGLQQQDKPNQNKLQHSLLVLKEQYPMLKKSYSKVLQHENHRLFSNLRSLAQRKKNGKKAGRLRFKNRHSFKTFTYNQSGFKIIPSGLRYDKLHLAKIDDIPFIMHRDVSGVVKQVTIKHYPSGKWFALIAAEEQTTPLPSTNTRSVGIDLGLMNYVADSEGNRVSHPKHLERSLLKLKKAQQRLSRKKKGSKNRSKQKINVARVHEKIANQRNDFLHKLSRCYVNNYGLIAVENLNINGLVKLSYNARNMMDASWSRFVQMLCFKAASAGCTVVKVEPRGTTQKCSRCGTIVPKRLWDRMHNCACGFRADRDYNAALNILKRALGQELPESTPVEIRTKVPIPPSLGAEQVQSLKQDAQTLVLGSSQHFL